MSATYGRLMTEEEKRKIEDACINNFPKNGIWNLPETTEEEQKYKEDLFKQTQQMINAEINMKTRWLENHWAAKKFFEQNSLIRISELKRAQHRVLAKELRRSALWKRYDTGDEIIYRDEKGRVFIDDTKNKKVTKLQANAVAKLMAAVKRSEKPEKIQEIYEEVKIENFYDDFVDRENYLL